MNRSAAHSLLTTLPPLPHLPAEQSQAHGGLSATLAMLAALENGAHQGLRHRTHARRGHYRRRRLRDH
ncbi:hypothetical protein [Streptosporangium sp. NPDC006007]|uniref:hypothetical protein n=1 Tax=Streptosporangium sp. NPDC006007 TaxID=3154575 RepID=UPI0033AE2195